MKINKKIIDFMKKKGTIFLVFKTITVISVLIMILTIFYINNNNLYYAEESLKSAIGVFSIGSGLYVGFELFPFIKNNQ